MHIHKAIQNVFGQLLDALDQLTPAQYRQTSPQLSNATIGQHVRHVVELFICLENGYETGSVNYDKRKRDHRIETDKELAADLARSILQNLQKADRSLLLETAYMEPDEHFTINTNYFRELVYNFEHTVHHMALIRVGINEVSAVVLPESFGVAFSTLKYRESCAQ